MNLANLNVFFWIIILIGHNVFRIAAEKFHRCKQIIHFRNFIWFNSWLNYKCVCLFQKVFETSKVTSFIKEKPTLTI